MNTPTTTAGARMRDWTTFRLGGPCRSVTTCREAESLRRTIDELRSAGTPHLVIGGGSNLLVSDDGIDAAIVRYADAPPAIRQLGGGVIEVGGAVALDDLALLAARAGLDGLRFASGIPGTVGGAIAGNAGAWGEQIADRLDALTVLTHGGAILEAGPGSFAFGYRRSSMGADGTLVLASRLRLTPGDPAVLLAERERILGYRRERHPDWHTTPTAGSFFKNIEPTSAAGRRQAAGWFLEQAGAKGMRVGGAAVFERHANIIVAASPDCTAADVHRLSLRMAAAVRGKFGLALEPEVRLIGLFPAPAPGTGKG